MLLEPHDLELFFKLHTALKSFVNKRLRVIPFKFVTHDEFISLPGELQVKVRDALTANLDLIQAFTAENPAHLSDEELDIVRSWRHMVAGEFFVFRELKKYTVFLSKTSPTIAYGVLALSQPFEDLIGRSPPVLTQAVLLPFKGRIIHDGLLCSYPHISFGPGIRRWLNEEFREAKARQGDITSLPMPNLLLPLKVPKPKLIQKLPTKEERDASLALVIALLDKFCKEHLTEEYAELCRGMAEKLGRKRPWPFHSGNPNAWACGIIRAIGAINLLHDKHQRPHVPAADIDHYFGISPSSSATKLAEIRQLLKIKTLDPYWTLLSGMGDMWMDILTELSVDSTEEEKKAINKRLLPFNPLDN